MTEYPIDFCLHLALAIWKRQKTTTYKPLSQQQIALHAAGKPVPSPYGQLGDMLWVREPWGTDDSGAPLYQANYARDGWNGRVALPADFQGPTGALPRASARSLLTVTAINVVNLQIVDEAAAKAAGTIPTADRTTYLDEFKAQWDNAYPAALAWSANPLVWRVAFAKT